MLEIYKDRAGEFRWRIKASNGQTTAAASEGFTRYRSCKANVPPGHKFPAKWQRGAKSWAGGKFSY